VKYPPCKNQSLTYNGPITLLQHETFDWLREQLASDGFQISLPSGA
jgi:hypothetical protein